MNQVISMHGWGEDSNFWEVWNKYFTTKGWRWQNSERGYGLLPPLEPQWTTKINDIPVQKRVAVIHSLGIHLLKENVLKDATDVVLLCSFSRFLTKGKENRALKTALQGMQKCLGTNREEMMLKSFQKKAYQPFSLETRPSTKVLKTISTEGRQKLSSDLELLLKSSKLPNQFPKKARVLIIEGKEDKIINKEAKTTLIDDLKSSLQLTPTFWSLNHTGHSMDLTGLTNKLEAWLEACA